MDICVRLNQRLWVSVSTWGRAAACFTDSACKKVFFSWLRCGVFGTEWGREFLQIWNEREEGLSLSGDSKLLQTLDQGGDKFTVRVATEGGLREVCGNGTAHIFPGNWQHVEPTAEFRARRETMFSQILLTFLHRSFALWHHWRAVWPKNRVLF